MPFNADLEYLRVLDEQLSDLIQKVKGLRLDGRTSRLKVDRLVDLNPNLGDLNTCRLFGLRRRLFHHWLWLRYRLGYRLHHWLRLRLLFCLSRHPCQQGPQLGCTDALDERTAHPKAQCSLTDALPAADHKLHRVSTRTGLRIKLLASKEFTRQTNILAKLHGESGASHQPRPIGQIFQLLHRDVLVANVYNPAQVRTDVSIYAEFSVAGKASGTQCRGER